MIANNRKQLYFTIFHAIAFYAFWLKIWVAETIVRCDANDGELVDG